VGDRKPDGGRLARQIETRGEPQGIVIAPALTIITEIGAERSDSGPVRGQAGSIRRAPTALLSLRSAWSGRHRLAIQIAVSPVWVSQRHADRRRDTCHRQINP